MQSHRTARGIGAIGIWPGPRVRRSGACLRAPERPRRGVACKGDSLRGLLGGGDPGGEGQGPVVRRCPRHGHRPPGLAPRDHGAGGVRRGDFAAGRRPVALARGGGGRVVRAAHRVARDHLPDDPPRSSLVARRPRRGRGVLCCSSTRVSSRCSPWLPGGSRQLRGLRGRRSGAGPADVDLHRGAGPALRGRVQPRLRRNGEGSVAAAAGSSSGLRRTSREDAAVLALRRGGQ